MHLVSVRMNTPCPCAQCWDVFEATTFQNGDVRLFSRMGRLFGTTTFNIDWSGTWGGDMQHGIEMCVYLSRTGSAWRHSWYVANEFSTRKC